MFGIRFKNRPPAGSAPGEITLPANAARPRVRVFRFSPETIEEKELRGPEDLEAGTTAPGVTWVDVQGLGDEAWIRRIREVFSVPPMAMSDVVHIPQRPKTEDYDHHSLFVTRMLRLEEDGGLDVEQISLIQGKGFLLTFQERHGDVLDPVRERLRADTGMLRKSGPDFLSYAIIDTIVDTWFPLLESLGDRLETLEDTIMESPGPAVVRDINRVKRTILAIRRAVWPTREALRDLMNVESEDVTENTRLHLRDTHDHCVHTTDIVQSYRETAAELMNTYLSVVGNRMNEVMKVLTIMASIFIPLTFLAGIYGMNFEAMPELKIGWAYPALLGVMAATAVGMILYFRNRGWIGSRG